MRSIWEMHDCVDDKLEMVVVLDSLVSPIKTSSVLLLMSMRPAYRSAKCGEVP